MKVKSEEVSPLDSQEKPGEVRHGVKRKKRKKKRERKKRYENRVLMPEAKKKKRTDCRKANE